jgi:hypothetical protein
MKWLIGSILVVVLCSNAEAGSKKPRITKLTPTHNGATFVLENPLRKKIKFKIVCKDAFMVDWIQLDAGVRQTVEISASDTIQGPCTLRWKLAR